MPKHAYLSASASHRWLACPPSAKLCANILDQASEYAQHGTDCHELCAYLVEKALGREVIDPTENLTYYDAEMQNCAEEYRNYVLEQIEVAKKFCKDPQVMIEQRLDFSRWVENGFGTGDCVIVADEVLQIIDYKHGLGVLVSAGDEEHGGNSQMMCYALGALEAFGDIYDINQIKMTLFQPRRDNVSTYTISKDDLLKWADEVLAPTAQLAYVGEDEFKAGIVDADRQPILERSEVYSGVYGRASINLYAFNSNSNKGIACGLNNLQKIRDGEPLGGKSRAEDDFASDEEDDFLE